MMYEESPWKKKKQRQAPAQEPDAPRRRPAPRGEPARRPVSQGGQARRAAPVRRPAPRGGQNRNPSQMRRPTRQRQLRRPEGQARKLLRWIKVLALLLTLCILAAGTLYLLPVSAFGSHDGAAVSAYELPSGYTNILLIGADINSVGSSRSDTMIILSVGKGRVCVTSLMRDTGVYIPGYEGTRRLNAAYSYGGADLLLKTVNQNFHLDLTSYIALGYEDFITLVDSIGGVDIENVSEKEVTEINRNMADIYQKRYDAGTVDYDTARAEYLSEQLTDGGNLHLDGMQALGFARIRKTDSDFQRTGRQREVLIAAMKRCVNPLAALNLLGTLPDCIDTNLNLGEIGSIGVKVLAAVAKGNVEELRLPVEGSFTDTGGKFENVNYEANYNAFIKFVYGG